MNTTVSTVPVVSSSVSLSSLIKSANEWRKNVIGKLWNAIRVVGDRSVIDDDVIGSIFADFITVGHRPVDKAFSDHDLQYFITRFENNRKMWGEQLAELRSEKGGWVKVELADRSEMMVKGLAIINLLKEEQTRRINDVKRRREEEKAAHQAWLDKQREKYTVKPKVSSMRTPNHAPHADKSIGKGLEALAVIKAENEAKAAEAAAALVLENRKTGKFISEKLIKKAELLSIITEEAFASLKTSGEVVLPDYRKITLNKAGAVIRYQLHE